MIQSRSEVLAQLFNSAPSDPHVGLHGVRLKHFLKTNATEVALFLGETQREVVDNPSGYPKPIETKWRGGKLKDGLVFEVFVNPFPRYCRNVMSLIEKNRVKLNREF